MSVCLRIGLPACQFVCLSGSLTVSPILYPDHQLTCLISSSTHLFPSPSAFAMSAVISISSSLQAWLSSLSLQQLIPLSSTSSSSSASDTLICLSNRSESAMSSFPSTISSTCRVTQSLRAAAVVTAASLLFCLRYLKAPVYLFLNK